VSHNQFSNWRRETFPQGGPEASAFFGDEGGRLAAVQFSQGFSTAALTAGVRSLAFATDDRTSLRRRRWIGVATLLPFCFWGSGVAGSRAARGTHEPAPERGPRLRRKSTGTGVREGVPAHVSSAYAAKVGEGRQCKCGVNI